MNNVQATQEQIAIRLQFAIDGGEITSPGQLAGIAVRLKASYITFEWLDRYYLHRQYVPTKNSK